ncbi:tannase and feruloyl esterase [Sanghuangporus baumii]|uniref:Carboxylic ester hydrolase n=1 Tax=Sanghuangporus baumii TaxID=108892 RepID=A0A9Q5HW09_SANBA|nr:tannase and feruloyl esterase [Sanghuangporus baumii]
MSVHLYNELSGACIDASWGIAADPSTCIALRTADFPSLNTTILNATYCGGSATITTTGTCLPAAQISSTLCRIQFVVNNSSISSIFAEAWFPEDWNQKFLALGNGGLNGCIDYANLGYSTSFGFASVALNNGHDGDDGEAFVNNTGVLADYTSRAIHTETVVGKQLVSTYYGQAQNSSYYMPAQPAADKVYTPLSIVQKTSTGFLPALQQRTLTISWAMLTRYIGAPDANCSASFIPSQLWNVISTEIFLRQCDALDGNSDGIITEPDECSFRPSALLCDASSNKTETCLTEAQVEALFKTYSPLYGLRGELLYSRYEPGTESGTFAPSIVFSGQSFPYTLDWMRYVVDNNPNYDFSNFGTSDIARMQALDPGDVSTFSGDYSAFRARGRKLVTYHGRADSTVPHPRDGALRRRKGRRTLRTTKCLSTRWHQYYW